MGKGEKQSSEREMSSVDRPTVRYEGLVVTEAPQGPALLLVPPLHKTLIICLGEKKFPRRRGGFERFFKRIADESDSTARSERAFAGEKEKPKKKRKAQSSAKVIDRIYNNDDDDDDDGAVADADDEKRKKTNA